MSQDVATIVNKVRLYPQPWSPFLVPYIPLGFVVVLLRSFIFLHVYISSLILSRFPPMKRFVLRCMCLVLGFIVTTERTSDSTTDTKVVVVSNHTSLFDHLILHLVQNCVSPHEHVFHWAFTYLPMKFSRDGWTNFRQRLESRAESLHLLPERVPTGDSLVLLKFDPDLFESVDTVQPVAIIPKRLFSISLLVHPVTWPYELFWQLFTPFTLYRVCYLPTMRRDPDETNAEFAERVRASLGNSLGPGSVLVDADSSDLLRAVEQHELEQERLYHGETGADSPGATVRQPAASEGWSEAGAVRHRHGLSSQPAGGSGYDVLVEQILNVLPDAPRHRILASIAEHGDVDTVIAMLLDDLSWQSAQISATSSPAPATICSESHQGEGAPVSPSAYRAAASNFSRDPDERHRSFEDRKQRFLDNARHRYLMKIGQQQQQS